MAVKREDVRVPGGHRQPTGQRGRSGADWREAREVKRHERTLSHEALEHAMEAMGMAKPEVKA